MLKTDSIWALVDQIMAIVESVTEYPVLIYDTNGRIIRATDRSRIGNLHPGALEVVRGNVPEYAVTADESARNPLVREGFNSAIKVEGQIIAVVGITGELNIAKPAARIAAKMIEAWIEKHNYQTQLELSEKKYRDIFDHSLHGIYQVTPDGQFLAANNAMAEILGFPDPKTLMAAITDIGDQLYKLPEDRQTFLETIRKAGQVSDFETTFRNRDGEVIHVRINARLKSDSATHAAYIEGLLEDITEKKRAEVERSKIAEDLERNANFTRALLNAVPTPVFYKDGEGRYQGCNQAFSEVMGVTSADIQGKSVHELWPREHADVYHRKDLELLEKPGHQVYEFVVEDRYGETRPVIFATDVFRDENGAVAGLVGAFLDITELKKTEEELRKANDIINRSPVVAFRWKNAHGWPVEYVSENVVDLFGHTAAEFISGSIQYVATVHPDDLERVAQEVRQASEDANTTHFNHEPYRIVTKDGDMRWVNDQTRIRRNSQGTLTHYEGIVYDITDRKQAEEAVSTLRNEQIAALNREIGERKKIEESLRLTQFIFEKAPIEIWRMGPTGAVLDVNEMGCASLGYTREELCQMTVFDFNPDLTPEEVAKHAANFVAAEFIQFETRHQRKNGDIFPAQVTSNVIQFEGQDVAVSFIQDITARKQMEQALKESEERYRTLAESALTGIYHIEGERFSYVNNAMADMFGYDAEDMVRHIKMIELVDPADRQIVQENIRRQIDGETTSARYAFRGLRRDGTLFFVEVHGGRIDLAGKPAIIGTLVDITQRRQDEEELKRLRNYLANIIDSMPSVLVGVDRDGRVTQWNKQAEHATGRPSDQAIAQPLGGVFAPLADQMVPIKTAIEECRVISTPKVFREGEQGARYEDITIFPLVANGVEGAVIRVDDVTERVRMEELMIQNEKMVSVGGLAAGMAHEINNPLAGILQNAAVMENRLLGDLPANRRAAEAAGISLAALQHYLALRKLPVMMESIRSSGIRATEIVKNTLGFARMSDRTISSQDLCTLLDRTIELVKTDYDAKRRLDFKKIRIEKVYDKADSLVPCDTGKIQQVFLNILKNGAEAMAGLGVKTDEVPPQQAPKFVIRVKADDDWVQVEIEDNGPGMDAKTRRSVFEPFFTTKPVGKGTGLGLSVSYFIVTKDHGGEMSVHASRSGGSCFVIRLPKGGKA